MTSNKSKYTKNCYRPEPDLLYNLNKLLRYYAIKNSVKDKLLAGEKLNREEDAYNQLSTDEKDKLYSQFRTIKSRTILDKYVFPSMANLVIFFQYAALPGLRELFDTDIQSLLFGVNRTEIDNSKQLQKQQKLYRFANNERNIFYRLITSILALSGSDSDSNESKSTGFDFRFVLYHILQREIWEMIRSVGPDKINDENLFYSNIVPDMGRAVGWTGYLSKEAQIKSTKTNFNPDKRPVLF